MLNKTRCPECFAPMPCPQHEPKEHPVCNAAREIKKLHEQNVALVDSGHVFTRTLDGVEEDVTQLIRQKSMEQIEICDKIIEWAPHMGEAANEKVTELLNQLEASRPAPNTPEDPELPEIGDYGHH